MNIQSAQTLKNVRRAAVPLAAFVGLLGLTALQLISSSLVEFALVLLAIGGIGIAQLRLPSFLSKLIYAPLSPSLHGDKSVYTIRCICIRVLLLAGIIGCCFFALETPYRTEPMQIFEPYIYIQLAMIALVVLTAYFAGLQRGIGPRICVWIFTFLGIAQYFVLQFKGTIILPTDLFALGTAAAVAGGYTYVLNTPALIGIVWGLIGNLFCTAIADVRSLDAKTPAQQNSPDEPTQISQKTNKAKRFSRVIANVFSAGVCFCLLALVCSVPNYTAMTGEGINYFYPIWTYQHYGSMLSFVMGVQDLSLSEPEGYTEAEAQSKLASYAVTYDNTRGMSESRQDAVSQFDTEAPNIVVVMDESFADLSIFEELHAGYEGPQYFKTQFAPNALASGPLSVSVLGGGTCNTEFEFLTGTSMAYLGAGKYPYAIYDLSNINALPKQLSALGYETTAIHPNLASNWHRDVVYEQLGFDTFHSIESFPDAPTLHNGVTNRATYDKVLETLNNSDDPQFVFDVTMQGHSNYDVGNIPEDLRLNYAPEGVSDTDSVNQLNEYLSCVEASDNDLKYLVDELSKLDKPVVLIYFGDHQPKLSNTYNDLWFTEESDEIHAQRTHQSVYAVWANYDVAGGITSATSTSSPPVEASGSDSQTEISLENDSTPTSPNFLAAQTLERIGAPLTDYQKAQLVISESAPAINAFGMMGSDGTWYSLDETLGESDALLSSTYEDLAWLTWLEFTSKVA